MPEIPSFETELKNLSVGSNNVAPVNQVVSLQTVSMDKLEINSSDGGTSTVIEKDNEISSCVVCFKKFKSKSQMNKHLRSVHAGSFSKSYDNIFFYTSVLNLDSILFLL